MLSSDPTLEIILSGIILLVAGVHFVTKMRYHLSISIVDVSIWMTAVFFGTGPLVALFFSRRLSAVDPTAMIWSYILIYLFIIGLFLADNLSLINPRSVRQPRSSVFRSTLAHCLRVVTKINTRYIFGYYMLVWFFRLLLGIKYGIFFSGTASSERVAALPYVVVVIQMILKVVSLGCLVWSCGMIWHRRRRTPLSLSILILEFAWAFVKGRRWIFEIIVIVALVLRICNLHFKARYIYGATMILSFVLLWVYPTFIGIRDQYKYSDPDDNAVIRYAQTTKSVIADQFKESSGDINSQLYQKNMAHRALTPIRFNCSVLKAQEGYPLMWGRAIWSTVVWAIPSAIYPQKIEHPAPEQYVQSHYNFQESDEASNWPAYGCADFGVMGGLLMGLLLGAVLRLMEHAVLMLIISYPFVALCLMAGALNAAIFVEASPNSLWSMLRSVVILYCLARGVSFLRGGGGYAKIRYFSVRGKYVGRT
ncbi:MAG: hypothetical protein GY869_32570 [Planctomycetes bacterium]|nr:hypothetical protein [Planctomycetota bacterium]